MLCYALLFAFSLNGIAFKMEINVMPLQRDWTLFLVLREKSTASAVLVYWIKMVHIEIHKLWQLKIKVYLKYVCY